MTRGVKRDFWTYVEKGPDCWMWTGTVTGRYGQVMYRAKKWSAHRLAYTLTIGPIPPGMTLDHLCKVKTCVNPAHLEVVTRGENTLRGPGPSHDNALKTACKNGHPFNETNTYVNPRGARSCRICHASYQRRWAHQNPSVDV